MKYIKIISVILAITFYGCSNSTESPVNGTLSLSTKYQTTIIAKAGNSAEIDSIKIEEVILLLREIKFKTQNDSTDGLYKTTPAVLELNLAGAVQNIGGLSVNSGTYNRLEFDIHKAEPSDTTGMTAEVRARVRSFFTGGDRCSIIIRGKAFTNQVATKFTYRSSLNAKQKINLAVPLVISETATENNATMQISSFGWFLENGHFLDPTDSRNFTKIDNNIKESIHVIKDKNKDGIAD